MTTIVAVQGAGWAIVGFDSRVSYGTDTVNRVSTLGRGIEKIAKNGDYLIGAAGDVRAINLLSYAFNPPKPDDLIGVKLDRFMTTKFIPALRKCFEDQGYAVKGSEEGAVHNSTVLVVVNGTIYEIDSDYAWARDTYGIYAAGSGGDYALGALHGMFGPKRELHVEKTKNIVRKALEVGARLDSGSGPPFHILSQSGPIERKYTRQPKKKPATKKAKKAKKAKSPARAKKLKKL
jgi:ATP-dependent protease HslVU (ClpYQ) peptidase subunit